MKRTMKMYTNLLSCATASLRSVMLKDWYIGLKISGKVDELLLQNTIQMNSCKKSELD